MGASFVFSVVKHSMVISNSPHPSLVQVKGGLVKAGLQGSEVSHSARGWLVTLTR